MAEDQTPATSGEVRLPLVGNVKKKTATYAGLGLGAVVIVYVVVRRRKTSSSTGTGATVTDPAGNVCAALDPSSGYCPGSAQDQAYYTASLSGGAGTGGAGTGGGGTSTDQGPGVPSNVGPGSFTSNAEWAQYAEQYMGSNGSDAIAAALGKYITGGQIPDGSQALTYIDEAIAIANFPPVQGPGGRPPGINVVGSPNPPPPPPPNTEVTVPDVTGDTVANANSALGALGLKSTFGNRKPRTPYYVTAQSPKAGAKVKKGSTVHLTIREGQP